MPWKTLLPMHTVCDAYCSSSNCCATMSDTRMTIADGRSLLVLNKRRYDPSAAGLPLQTFPKHHTSFTSAKALNRARRSVLAQHEMPAFIIYNCFLYFSTAYLKDLKLHHGFYRVISR